jgi:hypothetical protein
MKTLIVALGILTLAPQHALADCAHIPHQWNATADTALSNLHATYKATFVQSTTKKVPREEKQIPDQELRKTNVTETFSVQVQSIDKRTLLHHSTTIPDIAQIMVKPDKTEVKAWFSPNPCQALLFACYRRHDAKAFDYQFRVKEGQHLKLAVIEGGKYPLQDAEGHIGYTVELQGTPSGIFSGMDQAIDDFCRFAAAHHIDGWRQPFDQDEIMLCPQTKPWLKLEQVLKRSYDCIFPDDAPHKYDARNQLDFGFDATNKCSGIKGNGVADYGDITPEQLRQLMGGTRGIHWIKYGDDKMQLSAQLNCSGSAPKFECSCQKESEWEAQKPSAPSKPKPVPQQERTKGQKLKDLIFGSWH